MNPAAHAISRRLCLAGLCSLSLPAAARTREPAWLITPEEAAGLRESVDAPLWTPKAAAGAPTIDILKPVLMGDPVLASPLAIDLAFHAAPDATIDAASFRIFYGAFSLDVTQRLLKGVSVNPEGLQVEQAGIPSGNHRLVLQIADGLKRIGTRELRLSIR